VKASEQHGPAGSPDAATAEADPPARIVIFDGTCGVCSWIVRALARRDRAGRLRFVPSAAAGELVGGQISRELLEETMVAIDPATGRHWGRSAAVGQIARCLPFGRPFAWLIGLPGVRWLADVLYDAFARRRSRISGWLGLAVCEVPPRRTAQRDDEMTR
jgi:predicted DCC family thiol-disulfide oxidoreductase YuxK